MCLAALLLRITHSVAARHITVTHRDASRVSSCAAAMIRCWLLCAHRRVRTLHACHGLGGGVITACVARIAARHSRGGATRMHLWRRVTAVRCRHSVAYSYHVPSP